MSGEAEVIEYPGTEVRDSCKPTNVCAGNQTAVFRKSSKSPSRSHCSVSKVLQNENVNLLTWIPWHVPLPWKCDSGISSTTRSQCDRPPYSLVSTPKASELRLPHITVKANIPLGYPLPQWTGRSLGQQIFLCLPVSIVPSAEQVLCGLSVSFSELKPWRTGIPCAINGLFSSLSYLKPKEGGCFSQPPILLWAISQTSTLFMCVVDSANPWCFLALSQYSSAHCDPFLP